MLFKFKLLYSLGILPKAINVDLPVKYGTEELPRYKDKLPVSFDKDADNVTDAGDFCQNSKGGEVSTGCNSPQTEAFLADPFVEPKPKVESYIVNTPDDLKANRLKTDVNVKTGIQFFEKGSNDLSVEALEIMRELVTQLREVSSTNSVSIFVYSNDEGDSDKDYILSSKRAYNLYRILLKNSVSRSGIITYGKKYTRTGSDTPLNYIEISVKDSAESIDTVYEIFSSSDLSFNGAGLEKSAEAGQLDDAAYESIAQFAVLSKTISSSVSLDVINFSYDKESAVDNKNAGDARAEIIADEFRKTGVGSLKITSFGMDYELSEDDIVSGSDSRKNRTYLIIHR
jgi:outer membrane protein OmpA-like peptidoglycan-associated protein